MIMTKWIIIILSVLVLSLGAASVYYMKQYQARTEAWKLAMSNFKASEAFRNGENQLFQLTIEQLRASKDSSNMEILRLLKENKIKEKKIQMLQYTVDNFTKETEIVYRDSIIFKNPEFKTDTIVGDRWYSLRLRLEYPNKITTNSSFYSQKLVVLQARRETVEPPKKFFLARWFQKRHTIGEVNVIEENPYVKNKETKLIQIIK